jgi:methyl-accepting chemotaxis protein
MKGRLNSILWRAVALNVVGLLAIFVLAYSAGAHSGGLSILDFGALPSSAGLRLWVSALIVIFAALVPVWIVTRVLHPLKQLTEFSERLTTPDGEPLLPMITDDDFTLIADHLRSAWEQIAAAAADQSELASLRVRIGEFSEVAQQTAAGDLTLRAATADDALGIALASLNTALEAVCRLLEGARVLAGRAGDKASASIQSAQQATRTLAQQERDISSATEAFAVIPPSVKQITDNSSLVLKASQTAGAAGEQAKQAISGTQFDLQRLGASLRSSGETLSNLRLAAERVAAMLRPLGEITEQANLLALNAVLDAARTGQAGRTSTLFVEQFRDLAQESNKVSGDVATLIAGIHADCGAVLTAVERDSQAAHGAEAVMARANQSLESVTAAVQEASSRAEVVSLASARQSDAVRNVSGALQSAMDLERLAAQQARQTANVAEQILKSIEELNSALAAMRTSGHNRQAARAQAAVTSS